MSTSALRSRNPSSYSSVGQNALINYLQEHNQQLPSPKHFIPFLVERDSMNRLVGSNSGTIVEKRTKKVQITSNKQWKQNSQNRSISPIKQFGGVQSKPFKIRSLSNCQFRNGAATERILINYQPQEESIQQQHQRTIQDVVEEGNDIPGTQTKPKLIRQGKRANTKLVPYPTVEPIEQVNKFNLKLPLIRQQQYVDAFLKNNKKIAEMILRNKVEIPYKFPDDFEQKIIQLKRNIKRMKVKCRNWETEKEHEQHMEYLKEKAESILNKVG